MATELNSQNFVTHLQTVVQDLLSAQSDVVMTVGLTLVGAFTVLLIVRYGLVTALSGRGFDMGDFFQEVVLLAGAGLLLVRGYATPMPVFADLTFPELVVEGPKQIANALLNNSFDEFLQISKQMRTQFPISANPLSVISGTLANAASAIIALLFGLIEAALIFSVSYGLVAQSVTIMLGPLFIPFLLFPPMSFLFWSWFRALLQYSFYPLCAAAFVRVFLTLFNRIGYNYAGNNITLMQAIGLTPLCFVIILALLALPVYVSSLFAGGALGATPSVNIRRMMS